MAAAASMGGPGAALGSPSFIAHVPARAWRGLLLTLLFVLLLHLLFLRSVSRLLPDMPDGMAGEDAGRVFSTRSIRIDNREAATTAQATQDISKTPKPVAPTAPPAANTGLPLDAPQGNTVSFGAESAPVVPPKTDEAAAPPATAASGASPASSATTAPSAAVPDAAPYAMATASAPLAATPANTTAPPASDASASFAQSSTAKGTPPPAYNYVFPPSVRLKYDVAGIVKGFKYFVSGDLSWLHDGSNYTARLEISHFLLGAKVQTSKGAITPRGLEPLRFGEKVRSEVAAHFERDKGKVSFSANTPDVPLLPMAQDQVSIFVQLAAMFAAEGQAFVPGSKLVFQTVGARGTEDWDFLVEPPERLKIQGKEWTAYKLVREHRAEYDTRAELWLAKELEGLPVRIRLTQTSGDEIDMVWTRSQKP
jgi:Protein of unknown function (DUF3108)